MLSRLRSLWRNLRHRDRVDRDLDHEVRAVFDLLVDEKMQAGLSLEQARRAATLELGPRRVDHAAGARSTRRRLDRRAAQGRALRRAHAARQSRLHARRRAVAGRRHRRQQRDLLGRQRAAAADAAGPGRRTPARWCAIESRAAGHAALLVSVLRTAARRFPDARRRGGDEPRVAHARCSRRPASSKRANVQLVSGEFFGVLGSQPQLGRLLSPDDNRAIGGHPVAVISDAFWRRRFNGAADAIGREITLNGARFTSSAWRRRASPACGSSRRSTSWIPAMMQADVRYTQNFSAEQLRFPEALGSAGRPALARAADRAPIAPMAGGRGAQRGLPAGAAAARPIAIDRSRTSASYARSAPGARARSRTGSSTLRDAVPRAAVRADGAWSRCCC